MSVQTTTLTTSATTAATTVATTAATTAGTTTVGTPSKEFMSRLRGGTDTVKTTTVTTTVSTTSTPTTTETTTASTDGTTTQATTKARRRARAYQDAPATKDDIKQIATAVATEVVKATAPKAPEDNGPKLRPEEQKQLEVFKVMEEVDPAYKGLSDRAKKFFADCDAAEQDGKELTEERVQELKDKHGIEWNEIDFGRAIARLESAPIKAENEQLKQRLAKTESTATETAALPKIREAFVNTGREVAKQFGDTFAKLVGDDGSITDAAAQEAIKDDPNGHIILDGIRQAQDFSAALAKVFATKKVTNQLEERVIEFATVAEKRFLNVSEDARTDQQGRTFVRFGDYDAMTPAEQAKHWTLDEKVLRELSTKEIIAGAKQFHQRETERIDKILEQHGVKRGKKTDTAGSTTQATTTERVKPDSVDSGAGTQHVDAADAGGGSKQENGFFSRMKAGTQRARR